MNLMWIAFSQRGLELARRLARSMGGEVSRGGQEVSLEEWTARAFRQARGLVFVGAAGIAVRAIAPHVTSKTADPAVVAVDEGGRWAIPLLSGHLGGANDLARQIAALCGGQAAITTATDLRGLFAVDEWARRQNCRVGNPEKIKEVSARLLAGEPVYFCSDWPIRGQPPQGLVPARDEVCHLWVTVYRREGDCLFLIPRSVALGVGCRKGISREELEDTFSLLLERTGLWEQAFDLVCSVDLKKEEPGLLDFCREHGLPLETYSPQQLGQVRGVYSPSAFVARTVGVDNVCERSAVLGSGGSLIQGKLIGNGVTMAAALSPFAPDWRWQYG